MNRKLLAGALCGGLLAGTVWYASAYVPVEGQRYRRSLTQLDLTAEAVTPARYDALRAALPDCDILWLVPFQGQALPPDSTTLTVSQLSEEDIALLAYFPNLTRVDARDCRDYAALEALQNQYPNLTVDFSVDIGSKTYDGCRSQITVSNPEPEMLFSQLPLLPRLQRVSLTGKLPARERLLALTEAFPEIVFSWKVQLGAQSIPNTAVRLELSGQTLSDSELRSALEYLPNLREANLRGTSLTQEALKALAEDYPRIFFLWDLEIGNFSIPTDSTEVDLSHHPLASPEEIEVLLPYLPKAEKVILSFCGLDDETLDALNQRHPEVRIVWSVLIKNRYVRTDAKWFYPFKFYKRMTVNNQQLYPLRYCTDMEWVDIGHMFEVTDCEWARFMPNLTWLIIGETGISDLSPLSGCKKLKYLELFTIPVTDYSPLAECTGLEYLNLGRTYGDPAPIGKMPWLRYLWWCDAYGKRGKIESGRVEPVDNMIASLPDTVIKIRGVSHPTDAGWRQLEGYYEMRDYLGLFYLD